LAGCAERLLKALQKRLFFLAHPVLANQVLSMLLQDKRLWLWVIFVKMIRKGRHTTTHRQLIMLPGGAMIIDTPGMRELGMLDDVSVGLGETFSDVVSYLGRCKFSDCRHQTEPGCGNSGGD